MLAVWAEPAPPPQFETAQVFSLITLSLSNKEVTSVHTPPSKRVTSSGLSADRAVASPEAAPGEFFPFVQKVTVMFGLLIAGLLM